jgi:hypothetical protein
MIILGRWFLKPFRIIVKETGAVADEQLLGKKIYGKLGE